MASLRTTAFTWLMWYLAGTMNCVLTFASCLWLRKAWCTEQPFRNCLQNGTPIGEHSSIKWTSLHTGGHYLLAIFFESCFHSSPLWVKLMCWSIEHLPCSSSCLLQYPLHRLYALCLQFLANTSSLFPQALWDHWTSRDRVLWDWIVGKLALHLLLPVIVHVITPPCQIKSERMHKIVLGTWWIISLLS